MTIKEIKKAYSLSDKDIAEGFGYANANSYRTSSGKHNLDRGIEWLVNVVTKTKK